LNHTVLRIGFLRGSKKLQLFTKRS
jgi:hypothetical protein